MISAWIDPGSTWLAVTITAPPSSPAHACRYVDARVFAVGRTIPLDPPETGVYPDRTLKDGTVVPGKAWTKTTRHELTDQDRRDVAQLVLGYLLVNGVEALTIENVEGIFIDRKESGAAGGKIASNLLGSVRIAEKICVEWEIREKIRREARGDMREPRVELVLVSTWRARIVPLIKAEMRSQGLPIKGAGVLIRGKGSALEAPLTEHVERWPGGHTFTGKEVEHVRDSTGLALACSLPELPRRARSKGPRRPRVSRGPRGKREPMGPLDRAKRNAKARTWASKLAYVASCHESSLNAREAAGCICGPRRGRHLSTCRLHRGARVETPEEHEARAARDARYEARIVAEALARKAKREAQAKADSERRETKLARHAARRCAPVDK